MVAGGSPATARSGLGTAALELRPFNENDFDELVSAAPDAGFLLQWAGPQYVYPLDRRQLEETLLKAEGDHPSIRVFKAVIPDVAGAGTTTVGHVQLLDIDRQYRSCVLGRVLIFAEHRGKGLGKAMVAAALREAFDNLALRDVTLAVFDFNEPAVRTYRSQGFVDFDSGAHEFAGETWSYTRMALRASAWRRPRRPSLWRRLSGGR